MTMGIFLLPLTYTIKTSLAYQHTKILYKNVYFGTNGDLFKYNIIQRHTFKYRKLQCIEYRKILKAICGYVQTAVFYLKMTRYLAL